MHTIDMPVNKLKAKQYEAGVDTLNNNNDSAQPSLPCFAPLPASQSCLGLVVDGEHSTVEITPTRPCRFYLSAIRVASRSRQFEALQIYWQRSLVLWQPFLVSTARLNGRCISNVGRVS
jgi:hypothetical protein